MGSPSAPGGDAGSLDPNNNSYIRRSIATFRNVFNESQSTPHSTSSHRSQHHSWLPMSPSAQMMQNEDMLLRFMTDYWEPRKKQVMDQEVDLLEILGEKVLAPTVLTVPKNTPIEEAHIIFVMMRAQKLYVTHKGALCGELTVDHMAERAT